MLIAAVVLPLLAGAGTAADTATADPKALVLQLADLPTGFEFKSGNYVSNAQAARESKEPIGTRLRPRYVLGVPPPDRRRRLQVRANASPLRTLRA